MTEKEKLTFAKYCPNNLERRVPKSYEGTDCLYIKYCSGSLPATSDEHIFNLSWGGVKKRDDIICSKCNNDFSSTIDNGFDPFVIRTKVARGLITEGKKNLPAVNLGSGTKLRAYGLLATPGSTHSDVYEEISHDNFEYDLKMQYRSSAHTCLKALATYDPKLARTPIFDRVKNFIYNGIGEVTDFGVLADVNEAFLPTKRQFIAGEFNHVVLYFSKRLNTAIGVFHLLGGTKQAVIISNQWAADESILTVGEFVNQELSIRKWDFPVVDEGMPTIMEIARIDDEQKVKNDLRDDLKKYLLMTMPSYRVTKYFEKLDKDQTVLGKREIDTLKVMINDLLGATLQRTGNEVSQDQLEQSIENIGINALLKEYEGCYMDFQFSKRLQRMELEILASFDSKLQNLE
jgi:hypothetical protein